MATASFDSSTIFCDKTALKYYRTPPRYLGICPPLPHESPGSKYAELHRCPLTAEVLGFPLHVVAASAKDRSPAKTFRHHVISQALPFGTTRDTLHGFKVTSPPLTLFTLARTLTFNQLVMVAYEMCGRFTLFEPTPALETELSARGLTDMVDGWTRVKQADGKPTNQWMRPPLTTTSELRTFATEMAGTRGSKLFLRAIDCVSGMCASPFEAQLSMLLWMDPNLGGWGLRSIENNFRIRYSADAKLLTDKSGAEADLRVLSPDGTREWILECQGRVVHDRKGAGTKDALRLNALQSMGYNATLLTHEMIEEPEKFSVLLQLLADNLEITWAEKSPRQAAAENKLRFEIFGNWLSLANEPTEEELAQRRAAKKAERAPRQHLKRKKPQTGQGEKRKLANVKLKRGNID